MTLGSVFQSALDLLLSGILELIKAIISVLFYPIDLLINQYMPQTSTMLVRAQQFLVYIYDIFQWVLSYTGLSNQTRTFIFTLLVAIITIPLVAHAVKITIKWVGHFM